MVDWKKIGVGTALAVVITAGFIIFGSGAGITFPWIGIVLATLYMRHMLGKKYEKRAL